MWKIALKSEFAKLFVYLLLKVSNYMKYFRLSVHNLIIYLEYLYTLFICQTMTDKSIKM